MKPSHQNFADFDCALRDFMSGQVSLLTELVDRAINRMGSDALLGRSRRSQISAWAYRQFLAPQGRVQPLTLNVLIAARLHEIADLHGANALHAAVESFSIEAVNSVMATGNVRGGLHATDRHGCTPVQRAVHLSLPPIVRLCAPVNPSADYVQRTFGRTPARVLESSNGQVTAVREIIAAFIAGGVNPAHGFNSNPGFLTLLRQFHPSLSPLLDAPAA